MNEAATAPIVQQDDKSAIFPPAAYLIGAQKSATTSLASLLDQHPAITVSDPKEPNFFSYNWDRGLNWYRNVFPRISAVLVNASPSYSDASMVVGAVPLPVPKRIFQLRPDAKFLYIVREPASRTYSAYLHEVREGREKRDLRSAVREDHSYTDASFYHKQLRRYLEYFPIDRFLIITFDEFVSAPIVCAQRCARFLGVSADFEFEQVPPLNTSYLYNGTGKVAERIIGRTRLQEVSHLIRDNTPQWLHGPIKRLVSKTPPVMSNADRSWLQHIFAEDLDDFKRITGIEFRK